MKPIEIHANTYWVGVDDRSTDLFEGVWPIHQEGVSYNSYILKGEKNIIIDLSKEITADDFFKQVQDIIPIHDIDYLIINHMEPDHTGALKRFINAAGDLTIICSEKAVGMIESFYGITDAVQAVKNGETLQLGDRELTFITTPMVHWPESMMTYDTRNKILFSSDIFGGYGALGDMIFDDTCSDSEMFDAEIKRYYVNIVAQYSKRAAQSLAGLSNTVVDIVAPAHGRIWRAQPQKVIQMYNDLAGYAGTPGKPAVTFIYGTMYGNTMQAVHAVREGIESTGLDCILFDVARTHVSYILPYLWERAGVMIGCPTYEQALYPPMAGVLSFAAIKRITHKKWAYCGSYGWSKGAAKNAEKMIEPLKWENTGIFEFKGAPTNEDLKNARAFGEVFAKTLIV